MRGRCTRLVVFGLALWVGVGGAGEEPGAGYLHSIYYTAVVPTSFREDRCVYDVSTRERVFDLFAELSALGVNAVTMHSAYTADGALYPTDHPALRRSWRWPEDARPVDDFLAACDRFGVQGWLGVYLGAAGHPLLARQVQDDLLRHFGDHPRLAGLAPPIEGRYTGLTAQDFVDLCATIKQARPNLRVMDYPSSPYTPQSLHWLMRLAQSGQVDYENVQFHACDDQLEDLREARGLTLLTMGVCPGVRTIIHTHYKNGVHTPQRPTRWLPPARAWEVTQSALITATPWGTSIFSFLHACWGEEASDVGGDALWRRLKWYEGILGVQRLLPLYADSVPDAAVQVLVPEGTLQGAQDILAQCWLPLARAHIPASFCLSERNLCPSTRLLLVPALVQCSLPQGLLLQRFVADGGILITPGGPAPADEYYTRVLGQAAPTAHLREVLGLPQVPPVSAEDLDPDFVAALGFADGGLAQVDQPRVRPYHRGRVLVVPAGAEWARARLPQTVAAALDDGWRVEGLPESYVIERWRQGQTRMLLIMGIREGLQASEVRLTLPAGEFHERAWLIEGEAAAPLVLVPAGAYQQLTLPHLGDRMALVVLGECPGPILRPQVRTVRTRVGDNVTISSSLLNPTGRRLRGQLSAQPPDGWSVNPSGVDYDLPAGEAGRWQWSLSIPASARRQPYFLSFRTDKLVQRVIVLPEDGAPQVITERTGPLVPPRPVEQNAAGVIGGHWLSVTAGEPGDNAVGVHRPGVCFYAAEWGKPREYLGRVARYGEFIPTMAGPNFWINDPDRSADAPSDLVLRITYIAPQGGRVQIHDGNTYHDIAQLQPAEDWCTETWTVPGAIFATDRADYGGNYPGFNLLGQFHAPRVYVHTIQVRKADVQKGDEGP